MIICLECGVVSRAAFFLWMTACISWASPVFVPPDESFPLIDRGQLPMEVRVIEKLAQDYALLADHGAMGNAGKLRLRAQLIALSQRLSPRLDLVREIRLGLIAGDYQGVSTQEERNDAKKRIFRVGEWLLKEPKNSEAYLLGQLTLDVLVQVEPNHPLLAQRDISGLKKRWLGVIAPLEEFEAVTTKLPEPRPEVTPEIIPKVLEESPLLLTELTAKTPMILQRKEGTRSLGLVPLELKLEYKKGKESALQFKPKFQGKTEPPILAKLSAYFTAQGNPLPSGLEMELTTGINPYSARNEANLLAPLAMMLDSALSGNKLRAKSILFAKLNPDGTLTRPAQSWELLKALQNSPPPPGTRLLVPPSLAEELAGLLVIRAPEILFQYEVIACRTLKEASAYYLVAHQPPNSLVKASKIFKEITDKVPSRNTEIPAFLVFESVKKRLAAAAQTDARHLSASTLLLQASARRPNEYTRRIFAMEFRDVLKALEKTPAYSGNTSGIETLKAYHQARRKEWRAFADSRLIRRGEDDLLTEGQRVIDGLSPIVRKMASAEYFSYKNIEYEQWRLKVSVFLKKLDEIAVK